MILNRLEHIENFEELFIILLLSQTIFTFPFLFSFLNNRRWSFVIMRFMAVVFWSGLEICLSKLRNSLIRILVTWYGKNTEHKLQCDL